jgi:hypothetical protein
MQVRFTKITVATVEKAISKLQQLGDGFVQAKKLETVVGDLNASVHILNSHTARRSLDSFRVVHALGSSGTSS